ncbi:MAG: hydrogenase expression/formation protein HypE [Magnetococcus sp. YQC-5]
MNEQIVLGHGGGGRLSYQLIKQEILSRFGEGPLQEMPDAASLLVASQRLLFSTDTFVVHPLSFPGGDIGELAVYGTVNDLAVAGGRPRWLALSLILEEGFALSRLRSILDSIKRAADRCEVAIVTGDTKVVRRGQCDGLYITTSGIGEMLPGFALGVDRIVPGDRILVSGRLGDHGMAVLSSREKIQIEGGPQSDTRPVHGLVSRLSDMAADIHFMRDPTRGGIASVLNEVIIGQAFGMCIRENALPFSSGARSLAEMLGMDLLHVASEGCLVLFCAPKSVESVLERWKTMPEGQDAVEIGVVVAGGNHVVMETSIGGKRLVDFPQGELLPRIC